MGDYQLLFGDDGEPLAFLDVDVVVTEGRQLAFRMAANCQDHGPVNHLALFTRVGADGFTYVLMSALGYMSHLLDLVLTATNAAGLAMRSEIRAIAEGGTAGRDAAHQ